MTDEELELLTIKDTLLLGGQLAAVTLGVIFWGEVGEQMSKSKGALRNKKYEPFTDNESLFWATINITDPLGYSVTLIERDTTVQTKETDKQKKKLLAFYNRPDIKELLLKYSDNTESHMIVLNRLRGIFNSRIEHVRRQIKFLLDKEKEIDDREKQVKKVEGKKGKFKRSAHLTDQILKYSYPNRQPSLFDSLQDGSKKEIEKAGVEIKQIVEGIKLSPSETKIIDCLCKLLHENSQNTEPSKDDYYSGNEDFDLIPYGGEQGDKNTPAPKLAFTLYELTLEYKGGEAISGKDVDNVRNILQDLDSKKFLLSYVETTKKKDGGRIERKIEDFRKLISIVKISQTEFNKEDIELSKKEDTIIMLNPIFRRQIDSKFILYPNDINRRTIIAYGSHNLSDIALRLRDYLMRERSSKRYTPEINLDKLYYLLAEKWMKESRKKKVKEYTDRAIETVTALGLLSSHEIVIGASGEPKIIFTINKKWE